MLKYLIMKSILNLKYPILGLSPMDGITDSAFRFITKKYGNPDLIFTEFEHVRALCTTENVLSTFDYDESQRPIVAQIYGKEPEYFYHAAKIVCELGFDGVDINMGCPAKNVASSGSGAALIKTPELAKEIVAAVKQGVKDWVENGEITGVGAKTLKAIVTRGVEQLPHPNPLPGEGKVSPPGRGKRGGIIRESIPVSIKTRIGYDTPVTEQWIQTLVETDPDWITVHGRTLKQMYSGQADWNEIKKAVNVAKTYEIPVLANGDIKTKEDFEKVLEITGAAGALIGRASWGNPWVFKQLRSSVQLSPFSRESGKAEGVSQGEDVRRTGGVLLEHAKKFVELNPDLKAFSQLRKHFGWYIKGFDGAKELREKLVRSSSIEEVETLLAGYRVS